MSNFSNRHTNVVQNLDGKSTNNNKLINLIQSNRKAIDNCINERIKNDSDIDAVRLVIDSNQALLKKLLSKIEYLEEKTENYRLQYIKDKDKENIQLDEEAKQNN